MAKRRTQSSSSVPADSTSANDGGPPGKAAKAPKAKKAKSSRAKVRAAGSGDAGTPTAKAAAGNPASASVKVRRLSDKNLQMFRRLLLEKRAELVGDVSGMQEEVLRKNRQAASGDLSSMPIHMADLGTDNYEQEFTLGLLASERQLLRDIDEALERIESRTYGVCLGTGKAITKTRLKAKPWARYCIEYARLLEKGQVRAVNDH
ncbi:MAG TPA: TraR/DksA family transcriptional regulator [Phycisphaerae bacterium]|nr:TraR/DksA family transcriptional regulator [Phycisphaerae bacterium]